jgi:CubicO group peptidase (beta-lactamase class C family)
MSFFAYHGYGSADHKAFSDKYLGLGYKYLTLSIYGKPTKPLFAGVLLSGFTPHVQREFHGMNASQFADRFNTEMKLGWGPVMVIATGPAASETYAAVFEKMSAIPYTKNLLTAAEFDSLNASARVSDPKKSVNPSTILSWAGVHGTKADPRYIGIWSANPNRIVWNVSRLEPSEDQEWFDASNAQWARAIFSVYSPDLDEYVSIYRDDAPIDYLSDPAMTPDDYQKRFDTLTKDGYVPTCVQGSGDENVRITPMWTKSGSTGDRAWHAPTGPAPAAGLAGFDAYMKTFMTKNRVRAGALAVVKGTRLVLARGYTFAEPPYPVTRPDSIFRIASCSKLITAVAILQLTELSQAPLKLTDTIHNRLPFSIPAGTSGLNFLKQVTVDDLLCMIGGYDGSIMSESDVAATLGLQNFPINKTQRARAMIQTQALTAAPGTSEHYSNLSYSLLSLLLEKKTATTYADYVQAHILKKLKGSGTAWRPRLDVAAINHQPAGAVLQHASDAANGRTVLSGQVSDSGRAFVPFVYGGVDYSTYDGFGGWCMAAVDFAAFLAAMNRNPCAYFKSQATLALLSKQNVAYSTTLAGKTLEDPQWARGWSLGSYGAVSLRWWGGTLSDIGCYFSLDQHGVAIVAFFNTGMNNIDTSYWSGLQGVAAGVSNWGPDDFFAQYNLQIP